MRSTCFGFWSPAIRRISRSLLRSSSTCEPSDPLFGVVKNASHFSIYSLAGKDRKNVSIKGNSTSFLKETNPCKGTSPTIPNRIKAGESEAQHTRECQQTTFTENNVSDPSAGSPTETLLRLLLPLDNAVRTSSRVASRTRVLH